MSSDVREPNAGSRTRNPRGQGARLRNELLDAARRLLESGRTPAELSLRSVAAEAGVSPTAVYRHFPDHVALLEAIRADAVEQLQVCIETADSGAEAAGFPDPEGSLRRRMKAMIGFGSQHPSNYRTLVEIAPAGDDRPAIGRIGGLLTVAAALVAAAGSGVDPSEVASVVAAFAHGAAHLQATLPDLPLTSSDLLVDDFVDATVGWVRSH